MNFKEHWHKRVKTDEFRQNLNNLVKEGLKDIQDLNIGEVLDDIIISVEKSDKAKAAEFFSSLVKSLILNGTPIARAHIESQNMALEERVGKPALTAWREVVTQPVELPPETVEAMVNQPAVRELFTNIIHDSIMAFNKKVNPLSGALLALGIDKQIRDFIAPFMGQITGIAKDFMISKENTAMFQDFAGKIFDIIVAEKPAKYMSMPIEETSKLIAEALVVTLKDKTFQEQSAKASLELLKSIKEQFGSMSVKDYMDKYDIVDPIRDLEDWELDLIIKHLERDPLVNFLGAEFEAIK